MRVVVIGATGNLGTGVLRRLHAAGAEIVGVARRMPDASLEPYSEVTWRLATSARRARSPGSLPPCGAPTR